MFTYSALSRQNSEIRLVRFIESPITSKRLELELRHESMKDTKFNALSYVWGDCIEGIEIGLNGKPFIVGPNLYAGLKQLQENGFQSWIWIDSICIQQQDVEEKAWHVQRMGAVYSKAECVYIWLGLGSKASDRAMDFMSSLGPKLVSLNAIELLDHHNDDVGLHLRGLQSDSTHHRIRRPEAAELSRFMYKLLQHPDLQAEAVLERDAMLSEGNMIQGFREIAQRDYWHRIWVVQEVTLAKAGLVLCGTRSISLEHFESSFLTLWDCLCWDIRKTKKFGFEWSWSWLLPLSTRRQRRFPEFRLQLDMILHQTFSPTFKAIYAASDPRDIVFGLFGIIEDIERLGLRVDYNLSVAEVFTKVTKAFLRPCKAPDFQYYKLGYCCPKVDNSDGLPSWVPDWREIGRRGNTFGPLSMGLRSNATMGISPPTEMNNDGEGDCLKILRRMGCRVDVITEVMQGQKLSDGEWDSYASSALEFAGLGIDSGPGEDFVWRTVIGQNFGEISHGTLSEWISGDIALLVRTIMRKEQLDLNRLTPTQIEFINEGPYVLGWARQDLKTPQEQLEYIMKNWPRDIMFDNRDKPLFKTAKGMFGRGHSVLRPGDLVTLLWGVEVPIILRPRDDGGFTFAGDAYVDGIMNGEFLASSPKEEIFDIH